MQPRYDWHTGQDAWDENESPGLAGDGQIRKRFLPHRWRLGLAVILILSLIGASVFGFLNRRASTNTAAVEEDILRTNSLIFQALRKGDFDLLRSNLSGRDPRWVNSQSDSLLNGLVYERTVWGLDFQPTELDDSAIDIKLNPEWNSAELSVPLNFVYNNRVGITQSVTLEQTLIYRRSRERWLLSPADAGFWGERLVFKGQYLTLDYPARDLEIVERLAAELDSLVEDICEDVLGTECPVDFRVSARFYEDSPNVGAITSLVRIMPCAEQTFELPTPTLVGRPIDENGFEVLLAGYQSEIAALTLAHIHYPTNCDYSRLKIALLDYELSNMGFKPLPITEADYAILLAERIHLEQMFYAVQEDGETAFSYEPWREDLRPYYALIMFLIEEYDTSLAEIVTYIDRERLVKEFYWSTLHNWTDENFADDGPLEAAWEQFLIEKAGSQRADAPEFPNQNLRLVCYGGDITTGVAYPNGVLYELNLDSGVMTAVYPLNHTDAYMVSLPGDEGVVVAEQRLDFVRENGRVLFWEDEPEVLFETADNLLPIPEFSAMAGGDQILFFNEMDQEYQIFPLASCQSGNFCDRLSQPGFPIWPPSGELMMWAEANGRSVGFESQTEVQLLLRGLSRSNEIAGQSPFWLGSNRFGFIADYAQAGVAVTVDQNGNPSEEQVLFTLQEVDPFLALDSEAVIESVLPRAREPEDLIVIVTDRDGWASIYQVNVLRRWIQPLKERAFVLESRDIERTTFNFDLSPDDRWLIITDIDKLEATASIRLFDLETVAVHTFEYKMVFDRPMHWTMDWSAGDEWLAIPDNGYIRLINPAADYQDVIVPDGVGCSGAIWVND